LIDDACHVISQHIPKEVNLHGWRRPRPRLRHL
jgi:hypothetical protein